MAPGLLAQYLIIAVAVLLSMVVVLRKQFPGIHRRLRVALALPLLRMDRTSWLHALGRWLAPPGQQGGGKDCGGCNGCG